MSICIAGTQRSIKLKISYLVNITHNGMLFVKISFVFMQCSVHVYSTDYFFDNVFFLSATSEHQNQLRTKRKHAFLNHVFFFMARHS